MTPKNHKKDAKNKNMLAAMDSDNQAESSSDVNDNILCTIVQKEVNLSSLHHKEDKDITKLFCIKIQVNKKKWMLYFIPVHKPTS